MRFANKGLCYSPIMAAFREIGLKDVFEFGSKRQRLAERF